jgi:hypothetical protein
MFTPEGPIDASGMRGLTDLQCHRASNYGAIIDRLRAIDAFAGTMKPIWSDVEAGQPSNPPRRPMITGPQIQGAVMSALIHGANGIVYFNHSFAPGCITAHFLRDNCSDTNRPYVAAINAHIKELAPVLNAPSYRWTFNPDLDTALKQGPDGSYYIFAQQNRNASGDYTLVLPPDLAGATSAKVLYENRDVALSGGKFADHFDAEYTWHIYRVAK